MIITSVNNEKIKYLKKLKNTKFQQEEKLFLVEGEHLVNEALKANALKAQKERTKDLKQYQKLVDEARELYKQDPSSDNNYNWRVAVSNYNEYLKTHPYKTQKQLFAELDSENDLN